MSLRERPTLHVTRLAMKPQGYFSHLEFAPVALRALDSVELVAEKVRAAFQRRKVRDLYDLHRFATTPFDGELLRRLAVLKLWQVQDPFDPDVFFDRIRSGEYDWDDVHRLMRASERLDPKEILQTVEAQFTFLRGLSDLERALIADARSGRNDRLADLLRDEIRSLAARSVG